MISNFGINVAGALVPLVVSLVVTPVYIHAIGNERYGVLSIVWVLLGYFGFLDFGLSRAATNALARLRNASQVERAEVFVTAIVLNVAFGAIGSAAIFILGRVLFEHLFKMPPWVSSELFGALIWISVLFPFAMISGVGVGALEARERFLTVNCLQVAGTVVGQVAPMIVALEISPSLSVVLPAAAMSRALTVIVILGAAIWQEAPLGVSHLNLGRAKALLRYGGWITVTGLISPVMVSIDQFVIGARLSIATVPFYSVPMNLVTRSQIFPTAIMRTLFPRLSRMSGVETRDLTSSVVSILSFLYGSICIFGIVVSPVFFHFWIGADFARKATPVAAVLLCGAWINGLAFVPYETLQAQGKPEQTAKLHLLEIVPYLIGLFLLIHLFGLIGAAIAWLARVTVDAILLFIMLGSTAASLARAILIPLALMSAALLFTLCVQADLVQVLVAAFALSGACVVAGFVMLGELQSVLLTPLRRRSMPS